MLYLRQQHMVTLDWYVATTSGVDEDNRQTAVTSPIPCKKTAEGESSSEIAEPSPPLSAYHTSLAHLQPWDRSLVKNKGEQPTVLTRTGDRLAPEGSHPLHHAHPSHQPSPQWDHKRTSPAFPTEGKKSSPPSVFTQEFTHPSTRSLPQSSKPSSAQYSSTHKPCSFARLGMNFLRKGQQR